MASLLSIVAAFLVGLLAGWLIWGRILVSRRTAAPDTAVAAVPSETVTPEPTASVASPSDASPSDASPSVASPEPTGDSEPTTKPEPVAAVEPAVEEEPTPVVEAVPVPVAEAEPAPVAEAELAPVVVPEPNVSSAAAPASLTEPVAVPAPDKLVRIEGIGPKIAAALHAAGITTFHQLAETDVDALRATIKSAGLRLTPSLATWPEQARLLATGDQNGFAALADDLTAEPTPAVEPTPAAADITPVPEIEPQTVPAQRIPEPDNTAAPDDLTRIEGVGPKMARALNAAGIITFAQLAASDEAALRAAISAAGMRVSPSLTTWPQQAQLLADRSILQS